MKVTIECNSQREAENALRGEALMALFADFVTWCEGPGREENMQTAITKLKELAVIHGLPTT